MAPTRSRWIGVLGVVAALLSGCIGGSDSEQPSTPPDRVPVTNPAPSDFGRVPSVDDHSIAVRFVDFFVDDAADQAAREDGAISPGETLPNPFYIRDLEMEGSLPVGDDVRVTLLGYDEHGSPTPVEVSFREFAEIINSAGYEGRWYGSAHNVYHLRIHEGRVVKIRQIYTP